MPIAVWVTAIIGVVFVSLLSLLGALTLAIKEEVLERILIFFVSFSTGALFGDVFIHILPEITSKSPFTITMAIYFLFGILASFILEKVLFWNHHSHTDDCHERKHSHVQSFTYMILFADGIHNFIDGLVIGAGFIAGLPIGIATTIAVVIHEIPHEIGDFAVLLHGGLNRRKALFLNFLSAVTAIAGTVIALLVQDYIRGAELFLLCFAAANFIYIAGSNLIPELHRHSDVKRDLIQIATFIAGILIMFSMLLLEK